MLILFVCFGLYQLGGPCEYSVKSIEAKGLNSSLEVRIRVEIKSLE